MQGQSVGVEGSLAGARDNERKTIKYIGGAYSGWHVKVLRKAGERT